MRIQTHSRQLDKGNNSTYLSSRIFVEKCTRKTDFSRAADFRYLSNTATIAIGSFQLFLCLRETPAAAKPVLQRSSFSGGQYSRDVGFQPANDLQLAD